MDKNSSFKYDASAQMDSMLDAYRASHGMKPKKSSGERIITVPVQPKSKPVQLDKEKLKESTEETQKADYGICDINNSYDSDFASGMKVAKDYSYQRDARNQMDDMIASYNMSRRKNDKSTDLLNVLNSEVGVSRRFPVVRGRNSSAGNWVVSFILLIIFGIALIIRPISDYVNDYSAASDGYRKISSYVTVEGTVTDSKEKKFFVMSVLPSFEEKYDIRYKYTYQNEEYKSSSQVYADTWENIRNSSKENPKSLTVYVDPHKPSVSTIEYPRYPSPMMFLRCLVGVGDLIVAFFYFKRKAAS